MREKLCYKLELIWFLDKGRVEGIEFRAVRVIKSLHILVYLHMAYREFRLYQVKISFDKELDFFVDFKKVTVTDNVSITAVKIDSLLSKFEHLPNHKAKRLNTKI
ncbi:hypothetical protein L9F63_005457, partial [Diploptera punctata]